MDILKRLLSKLFIAKASDNNVVQETTENNVASEEEEIELGDNNLPRTSVNLMNKFFRFQRSQSEPPEFLYENEAWSPNQEYVGLFHKGSHQTQDQDSTPLSPQ
ncbi:hypothetical protein [Desulfosporosinus sp. SB140]|uniref:hypothetical protein n=1 Tax=Desulfosporosinus paludis TaxID=3115649 RepID=UPI00388CF911